MSSQYEPLTADEANRSATKSRSEILPFSYAAAAMAVAHFHLAYYRFVLKATTDMQLPAYKGSAFRGGFGHALKRTVCITPENVCHTCRFRTQCLYPYIFDTKLETHDAEGDGEASLPRPFVLVPPLEDYQHYHPGDLLTCDLVLIGEAIAHVPHFIATMAALGGIGVGKGKGSFTMTQVQALRPQAPACEIYAGHEHTLHNVYPPVTGEELVLPYQRLSPRRITLAFVTPTRLKHQSSARSSCRIVSLLPQHAARLKLPGVEKPRRTDTPGGESRHCL